MVTVRSAVLMSQLLTGVERLIGGVREGLVGEGGRLPNIDSATVRGICQAYLRACVGNKHLMSLTNNVDSPTIHYTSLL